MKIVIEKATVLAIDRAVARKARLSLPVRRPAVFQNRKREARRRSCRGKVA